MSPSLVLTLAAAWLGLAALAWRRRKPSSDRDWAPDQARMPRVSLDGSRATIEDFRNFRWTGPATFEPHWETRTCDLDRVTSAWYVIVPFTSRWRGPAHSFVSFGFDDGRYFAVSIEARREVGETYGVLKGLLRCFELIYVIGDEADLIGRRAVYDGTDVYLYQLKVAPEPLRVVLRSMLERANALQERPEFYHSFTNNCTVNLVRHAREVAPGQVPAAWRVALPGYSDEVAREVGLIESPLPLEQLRAAHRINDRAREAMRTPEFSAAIRA